MASRPSIWFCKHCGCFVRHEEIRPYARKRKIRPARDLKNILDCIRRYFHKFNVSIIIKECQTIFLTYHQKPKYYCKRDSVDAERNKGVVLNKAEETGYCHACGDKRAGKSYYHQHPFIAGKA